MKIGVYTNLAKDEGLEITKTVVKLLEEHNIDFYLYSNVKPFFEGKKFFYEDNYAFLNKMITIGGDGTVLNLVKDCLKYNIPMITINKGRKGFLNEIELINIGRVIDIINGNYRVDRRQLISVSVGDKEFYALNEAFVSRNGAAKMISLDAIIENHVLERYFCDGLIICSPTGSTAYSLSAGGPVISPKAAVMCLTPVCSHSLHSRPIILNEKERVKIVLGKDFDDAVLTVDGVYACKIGKNDIVEVTVSDKTIDFLRLKESNFYAKLLDKLNGLI